MEHLYTNGIYSTGTVRSTRKGLPLIARSNPTMVRGEFKWRSREHTNYVQWKDTKSVHVLSTAYSPTDIVKVNRRQRDGSVDAVNCPMPIMQYTSRMGGVDQFDQLRESYTVSRRSCRWWLRIFYFFLDAALVNSHVLYNSVHPEKPLKQLQFRTAVFRGLAGNFTSRARRARADSNF